MTHDHPILPRHLAERVTPIADRPIPGGRSFVLYWMHHAVRADENPALDAALVTAGELGLPVLVYHGLGEHERFATDRHHRFQLEGAADVADALERRGIAYACHVERAGHRGPVLADLARQAAMLVTETMPTTRFRRLTRRLAGLADAPVIGVDTACEVPMPLAPIRPERAFAYRQQTATLRAERLHRPWPVVEAEYPPLALDTLPFSPVDPRTADHGALIAASAIDHTVGPVGHTRGGSAAGYARFRAFLRHGLARYADQRNDALAGAVSRISAYLHFGHVSPFRIAREAADAGAATAARRGLAKGAEKWLDELLVWREMAYAFCYHAGVQDHPGALPDWARASLTAAESDTRPVFLDRETLARGRTGERLWDAAQASLLVHGELHNNVRMTWGKAVAHWTPDARSWLSRIVTLNHRYALDGSDPASCGGLLWCLGGFDRPFQPAQPVFGTVRPRSTESHARRLDPERYAAVTRASGVSQPPRVAVIGAGIAGLLSARTLGDHGFPVALFDKGRGPGGRLATRRRDHGHFDHGAQFITVRDRRFARLVAGWADQGLIAPWTGRIVRISSPSNGSHPALEPSPTRRYVGTPGMSAIGRHLAETLPAPASLHAGVTISDCERRSDGWWLSADDGDRFGPFDELVITAPPPQAAHLLRRSAPNLAETAEGAAMAPCWAVLVTFGTPVGAAFDGAFIANGPLGWVARNASKPGRPEGECWILHASPDWSRAHLEDDPDFVIDALLTAFEALPGVAAPLSLTLHAEAHRWRYAMPITPTDAVGTMPDGVLMDEDRRVTLAGDWCRGGRVEGAALSGMDAAGRILGRAHDRMPAPDDGGWPHFPGDREETLPLFQRRD